MILNNRLDFLLQFLAMGKLLVNKQLHFAPVSNTAYSGFSFVPFPDFGIISGDPEPYPLKTFRQPLRTFKGFLLPTFFLLLL